MTALVTVEGLRVGYRGNGHTSAAVRGVDLTIESGEVVALVGESGSGKTTIGQAIIGLLPANAVITSGSISVVADTRTVDTTTASETELRRLRGSTVSLVPQDPMVGLNPTQRIGAQVAEAVRLGGARGPQVAVVVAELLERAGLDDPALRSRQYPHELSGGQRQRVLIAIALARRPKLVIADEPTSALDVTVQRRILDHLEELVRESGTSLLVITHDLAVAADRADRVVVLESGRVVESGKPGEILVAPKQDYTRRLIAAAPGLGANNRDASGRIVPRFSGPVAPRPEPILTLDNVAKTFAVRGGGTLTALEDLFLRVDTGRTHALVGESGSGKSTALRIALGLESATSGRVTLDGHDLSGLGRRDLRQLRRSVQLVQQNPFAALDPRFTVGQSIAEPLVSFRVADRASRRARVAELLDQVALPGSFAERLPSELSGGQRQRVAIARALAVQPKLVLLDEPVSALDVSVQDQILTLLRDLQERWSLSYLFVSHDLAVVAELAHTVTVLRRGRAVEDGPAGRVFGAPATDYTREFLAAIPGQTLTTEHATQTSLLAASSAPAPTASKGSTRHD